MTGRQGGQWEGVETVGHPIRPQETFLSTSQPWVDRLGGLPDPVTLNCCPQALHCPSHLGPCPDFLLDIPAAAGSHAFLKTAVLVAQWLRLYAFNAGVRSLVGELRSHML